MQAFHLLGSAPFYTNSFLLLTKAGHAVIIDPAAEVQEYDKILRDHGAVLTHILCTHGHTEGSVVLLCSEYLFVGDTVFQGSIGRADLEGGSDRKLEASLRKFAGLPIPKETQLLPGHGDFSTYGEELETNYYIKAALRNA